jgi:hypothetical protein
MTDSYFDTTDEPQHRKAEYVIRAKKQDNAIYALFGRGRMLTPSQVWKMLGADYFGPLTSVRRSITVLTARGFLEKTNVKGMGIYGRPEYHWKITTQK